jgi:hypothetical protein
MFLFCQQYGNKQECVIVSMDGWTEIARENMREEK